MSDNREVTVYSKDGCVWCDRTRDFLISIGVHFTEVKIDHSLENRDELMSRYPEAKTVPQVFVDNSRVGGYNDTVSYFKSTRTDGDGDAGHD